MTVIRSPLTIRTSCDQIYCKKKLTRALLTFGSLQLCDLSTLDPDRDPSELARDPAWFLKKKTETHINYQLFYPLKIK